MFIILENLIVKTIRFFEKLNVFKILVSLAIFKEFVRGTAAFVVLAAGFGSLGWLSVRLDQVCWIDLSPWQSSDGIPRRSPLVVVDAGHGGHDGGAVANGMVEKTVALDLAQRLRRALEAQGARVVLTRETDVFLPLEQRSAFAEQHGAAAFVSLHLNTSVAATAVSGIETYFATHKSLQAQRALQARLSVSDSQPVRDERGEVLARSIQQHVCRMAGAVDRGCRERGYAVVMNTACPAVLVECGFLTNDGESARLRDEAYRDMLAQGLARGVVEFLQTQEARPIHDVHPMAVQALRVPVSQNP